jgi:hypothetical protein
MKHPSVDQIGIASRIRGLLGAAGTSDYAFSARRLGVTEIALRMSADELDPHPTFEVIVAVIREYGVDPAWLVSGQYDPNVHRTTLDASDEHRVGAVISTLLAADARDEGLPPIGRLEA